MKNILALVLALMTLLPLFVACGTPSEQPKETTGETEKPDENDPFNDEVPDQDFEQWEFYDLTLMGKIKRDDESEEMLNITFDGLIYDMGITFVTDLGRIPLRTMITNRNTNIKSWWASNQRVIEANFKELFDYVQGIEGEGA